MSSVGHPPYFPDALAPGYADGLRSIVSFNYFFLLKWLLNTVDSLKFCFMQRKVN